MAADVTVDSVAPDQVLAAREYIRRIGNPRLVAERIVAVANLPLGEVRRAWAKRPIDEEKIHAAQLLIELRGGEQYVEPHVVAMAHAKPAAAASPADASSAPAE